MGRNKTKRREKRQEVYSSSHEDRVLRVLTNLNHRQLQRECVGRGMPFELVFKSHHVLVSWFYKNFDNTMNETALREFDAYIEKQLEARGYKKGDAILSPSFRFGFYGDGEKALEKPQDPKPENSVPKSPKKPKAEIDKETGVRKGTKKAMTFELTLKGVPIAEIVTQVKAAFPDAQEKSIKIWHKRVLKEKSK